MTRDLPQPVSSGSMSWPHELTCVYRAYDADGGLLYVGLTRDVSARMAAHSTMADWARLVRRVEWEQFATRADAERMEQHYIGTMIPEYNLVFNSAGTRLRSQGHTAIHTKAEWGRLGHLLRGRREALKTSRTRLAGQAGCEQADIAAIERGWPDPTSPPGAALLDRLDNALDLRPGSWREVLAGGDLAAMSEAELSSRMVAAFREISV